MRRLHLVGMALPQDKSSIIAPYPSGTLGESLVPLDPRHGIFPNLVATPLLSALYYLHDNKAEFDEFFLQVKDLMEEASPRRVNVLQKPDGTQFKMDNQAVTLLSKLDSEKDLLLIFGYWSISAVVMYLIHDRLVFSQAELSQFSKDFLRAAIEISGDSDLLPRKLPRCIAPLPGLYFRLCSDSDTNGLGAVSVLKRTVEEWVSDPDKVARIVKTLRCIVPLPHNEAYQTYPFGKIQNCFMLGIDPADHLGLTPPDVFWRFMGKRIRDRLLTPSPPTP